MTRVIYSTYSMSTLKQTKYSLVYVKTINNRKQKKVEARQNIVRIFTNIIMLDEYVELRTQEYGRWFMVTLRCCHHVSRVFYDICGVFSRLVHPSGTLRDWEAEKALFAHQTHTTISPNEIYWCSMKIRMKTINPCNDRMFLIILLRHCGLDEKWEIHKRNWKIFIRKKLWSLWAIENVIVTRHNLKYHQSKILFKKYHNCKNQYFYHKIKIDHMRYFIHNNI